LVPAEKRRAKAPFSALTTDYELITNSTYNADRRPVFYFLMPTIRRVLNKVAVMALQEIRTPTLGQALRPNIWDVVALILVIGAKVLIVYGGEQTTLQRKPASVRTRVSGRMTVKNLQD
jgi:hypothetical protein